MPLFRHDLFFTRTPGGIRAGKEFLARLKERALSIVAGTIHRFQGPGRGQLLPRKSLPPVYSERRPALSEGSEPKGEVEWLKAAVC